MQPKTVSIRLCRFTTPVVLALTALLTVTMACGQTTPPTLTNRSFQEKRVWTHYIPQVPPDFNVDDIPSTPYGSLYPLELKTSYKAPGRVGQIQRMRDAGINGVQVLVYGSGDGTGMKGWLSAADIESPGFLVAPCIAVDTEDEAVRLVQGYASVAANHASAAKENGKLVVFTYGARYGKSPDFWRNVRNRLDSAGIATFLVNDTGANLGVNGGLQSDLLTPYFPVFDASYMFDDRTPYYWNDILSLFNQYNHAYAGGVMPGANREIPDGANTDARATEHYRQDWEAGLKAGLQWQTTLTWNDIVEHTEIRPTSDWNWTRADITAFYSARLRATPFPKSSPQLYITTPQKIHLGKAPRAEGLILNSQGSTMTVNIQLFDGNGQPYGDVKSATVPASSAGAVTIPDNLTVNSFPAGRFLRAKATMYDSAGNIVQQVTSAPILVYGSNEVPELLGRTLYYSIPAARALPGSVQLTLSGSPVSSSGGATATVTPPEGTVVRFAEVLQNTRQVKNLFNQAPFTTPIPLTNGGAQAISTSPSGFYMARVIDEQERVGYSDPFYVP